MAEVDDDGREDDRPEGGVAAQQVERRQLRGAGEDDDGQPDGL